MVHEFLSFGAQNAFSGQQLSAILGTDLRSITKQIEKERQAGIAICATTTGENRGYFIAENIEELANYLRALNLRIKSVQKTQCALNATLSKMLGQYEIKGW